MWKENGKTNTLSLFPDSLSPKTEKCVSVPLKKKRIPEVKHLRSCWIDLKEKRQFLPLLIYFVL
jgi:hypothetical protein